MGQPTQASVSQVSSWLQRVERITRCRLCGNPRLERVIHLGDQVLASLFDDGTPENQLDTPVPLEAVRCQPSPDGNACGLLQLTHTVPPDVLYRDYGYRSGINTTMRTHLRSLIHDIEARVPLKAGDLVLDIGANDGTALLAYATPGLVRAGFEPSNIRPEQGSGLIYLNTTFQAKGFLERFPAQRARVVTSIAMFYDLNDPAQFCRELGEILSEDGLWVLEMSYLGAMLEHNTFDNICHEHLAYYSICALQRLLTDTGFMIEDLTFNDANGGSLRCYIRKRSARLPILDAQRRTRDAVLQEELAKGYDRAQPYEAFRHRVEGIQRQLKDTLSQFRRAGKRVYGYGASTKGNVLLQYCQLGPEDLVAIADRNPHKVGRRTLGTRIPICSEEDMRQARPDYPLVLPWHFLDEFCERERALRSAGTQLVVAFPQVRIL